MVRKTQSTTITNQNLGRVPVAIESEKALIGAGLRDSDFAEELSTELNLTDFYSSDTQAVFKGIQSLLGDDLTVNPVSVSERTPGAARSVINEFLELGQGIGRSEFKTLVSELKRIGQLRSIYTACLNASSVIGKDSKVEDVIDSLERGLYGVDKDSAGDARDGSDVYASVVDDFIRRQADGGGPQVSTGLRDLDRSIIGLRPGKMGVIAARPSMGKTALASSIRRAVLAQGYGVIEFALEMSAEELGERELAYQAGLGLGKVLAAKGVSNDELERVGLSRASGVGFQGRWFIDDRTYSIAGIRRKSRILSGRMARQGIQVGCVIIDYLQLAGDNGDGREQSIAGISRGCKFLAKELGCTVLALSQLNRSCEYRDDRRPIMSDLRESGSIEQDADWVGFVYREHMYDNSFPAEETEFIIRKHRSGPTGTIHLRYLPKLCAFTDRPVQPTPAQNLVLPGVQNQVRESVPDVREYPGLNGQL